jgi:outer membrane protein TolC
MYRVKREVTQQDVLQVQVALSRLDSELINFHQQKESAQAKLARLLHVSPETKPEAMDSLPPEQTVQDIQRFYELAIEARPELHAQLATIEKDRRSACLAELNNYPDLTLGFNWIATSGDGISPVANGDDAFMLTLGMNLPVYKKRIDAGVREAQTRALSNARKYDRLKDEAMEGVADLFAKIKGQQENLRLFRNDIIPKQKLTLEQSIDDYQVGKVDFLQMIDNWRQLLRFHIAEKRFETDLQQTMAALARQVGSFELPTNVTNPYLIKE